MLAVLKKSDCRGLTDEHMKFRHYPVALRPANVSHYSKTPPARIEDDLRTARVTPSSRLSQPEARWEKQSIRHFVAPTGTACQRITQQESLPHRCSRCVPLCQKPWRGVRIQGSDTTSCEHRGPSSYLLCLDELVTEQRDSNNASQVRPEKHLLLSTQCTGETETLNETCARTYIHPKQRHAQIFHRFACAPAPTRSADNQHHRKLPAPCDQHYHQAQHLRVVQLESFFNASAITKVYHLFQTT